VRLGAALRKNEGVSRRGLAVLFVAIGVVCAGAATAAVRGYPAPPRILRSGQHPYSSLARRMWLNYLLYAPGAYAKDAKRRWPLIVFLHGSGEGGTDPLLVEALRGGRTWRRRISRCPCGASATS